MRTGWLVFAAAFAMPPAAAQARFDAYGRLDLSLVVPNGRVDSDNRDVQADGARLSTGSRNRVGLIADGESAGSWRMRIRLEQSFLGLNGERLFGDARPRELEPLDALAVVSISHYARGRLDAGRRTSLISDMTNTLHPWGGETVAGDRCAAILRWPCPHNLDRPPGFSFETPVYLDRFTLAVQGTLQNRRAAYSGHLVYSAGIQRIDLGFRASDEGNWTVPLGLIQAVGPWRVHALFTLGRKPSVEGGRSVRADYAFLGGTLGWRGGELRVGTSRYRHQVPGSDDNHVMLGLGYHYPVRPDVVVYSDVAVNRGRPGTDGVQADLGVKVVF